MFHEFEEVPFQRWGPWKNHWGYVVELAQFDEDDIILKTLTPYGKKVVKRFTDWEECEGELELIDEDRRF